MCSIRRGPSAEHGHRRRRQRAPAILPNAYRSGYPATKRDAHHADLFAEIMSGKEYNYDTFRREMMKEDLHFRGGPPPGEMAPDFDLPTTTGGRFRLSEHRGKKPVLLQFGSIT